ncbi:hypothetical protein FACS1894217_01280 [Clostridia bacterium]|nr:hypothetical protein FACS1894217_01280 [Clostridia bacterium]
MGFAEGFKKVADMFAPIRSDYEPAPEPIPIRAGMGDEDRTTAPAIAKDKAVSNAKVVNIHTTTQLRVVVIKPTDFETSALEIADLLRSKHTVVMNLELANKTTSNRLTDFLGGVAYALDGKMEKIATYTYIITPYNVEIMLHELLDNLDNNGMFYNS